MLSKLGALLDDGDAFAKSWQTDVSVILFNLRTFYIFLSSDQVLQSNSLSVSDICNEYSITKSTTEITQIVKDIS